MLDGQHLDLEERCSELVSTTILAKPKHSTPESIACTPTAGGCNHYGDVAEERHRPLGLLGRVG